jgi:bifunctional UDP-N-acetylglucosamine pyrophosphorylase/glucosamine-1-phosphate N-acetyltransferase
MRIMDRIAAVILAAGKSTRWKSEVTKLVHPLGNKPLVRWVADACLECGIKRLIFVVSHQAERVISALGKDYEYVYQHEPLGTGHALLQAADHLADFDGDVLVLAADSPFVSAEILKQLISHHHEASSHATILTGRIDDPGAYGRIVRGPDGQVQEIVEAKDATPEQRTIEEVNSATYCFAASSILPLLPLIDNDNVKGEYLLTDVIRIARERGLRIESFVSPDPNVIRGVNTKEDFEIASRLLTLNPEE